MEQDSTDRASRIKLLVLDVDGVLTDGSLFFGTEGETLKRFHVRDGVGIRELLAAGISVAVISSRSSPAVERRMTELGVVEVLQACNDKLSALTELVGRTGVEWAETACIGDDLPDMPMLQRVGLSVAVADAPEPLKEIAHYVTSAMGGHGAVREVCDLLLMMRRARC